jgi:hypothetical protein
MQFKLAEVLFWFHWLLIGCVVTSGLWLSVWMVIGIMALHRLQFIVLGGCVLSQWQERIQPFPEGMSFLQYTWFRATGQRINLAQEHVFDAVLVGIPIVLALIR